VPRGVLSAAVEFLDTADLQAAHYVEELSRRVADLEREKLRFESERKEFADWKQKEIDQLKARHREEIARVEKKLDRIVRDLSDRASRELESVRDESARKFQKRLANARAEASREIEREKEKAQPASREPSPRPSPPAVVLAEGQMVRVTSLAVMGRISLLKEDEAEVLVGNIKLRRPLTDLEAIEAAPVRLPENVRLSISSKQLERSEINVVGKTVDEAVELTDKFLDDAFLAQVSTVRIVHGMGTGALRQAISELLRTHPHVSRFESAPPSEGGRGVTVVALQS
jgi:DNA mismatch repair protein MutS2